MSGREPRSQADRRWARASLDRRDRWQSHFAHSSIRSAPGSARGAPTPGSPTSSRSRPPSCASSAAATSSTPSEDAGEADLRDEIEAEIEAATPRGGARRRGAPRTRTTTPRTTTTTRTTATTESGRARGRSAARGRRAGADAAGAAADAGADAPASSMQATFDHGDEGYGLWLDPAVADDPVYAEHWAGHRPVEVTVEPDRIVIRRTGGASARRRRCRRRDSTTDSSPCRGVARPRARAAARPPSGGGRDGRASPACPPRPRPGPGRGCSTRSSSERRSFDSAPSVEQPAHARVADRGRGVLEQEQRHLGVVLGRLADRDPAVACRPGAAPATSRRPSSPAVGHRAARAAGARRPPGAGSSRIAGVEAAQAAPRAEVGRRPAPERAHHVRSAASSAAAGSRAAGPAATIHSRQSSRRRRPARASGCTPAAAG